MTTIERLKELEQAAREVSDSDWSNLEEFLDTNESHVFAYALQEAWPKLLAAIEASSELHEKVNRIIPEDGMKDWLSDVFRSNAKLLTAFRNLNEQGTIDENN